MTVTGKKKLQEISSKLNSIFRFGSLKMKDVYFKVKTESLKMASASVLAAPFTQRL